MAVTEALRQSIILGAVNMSGEVGEDASAFEARVKANAKRLTGMLSEHSPVAKTIDMIDEAKKFPATILYVGKEPKTNRAFVVLKTKPTAENAEGIEGARTEIVDWESKSGEAYAFGKTAQALKGHRVFVYIELQVTKSGRKVRVLQHVEDLGEDTFITDDDFVNGKAFAQEKMSA